MTSSASIYKITCIVTCYNYAKFIEDAITSALIQTRQFDEIIVIDDASSDGSLDILRRLENQHDSIKLIQLARNSGQLFAFEAGFNASTGDIICFLDADDLYTNNYAETIYSLFVAHHECDFAYCGNVKFEGSSNNPHFSNKLPCRTITPMGVSLVRTLCNRVYIGGPTSCLSIRRAVVDKIFPLPLYEDWRTRADDCLVFGSSLLGARKYRIKDALVGYRIHGKNAFANNKSISDAYLIFRRYLAIDRLFDTLLSKFNILGSPRKLGHIEFKTIPHPTYRDLLEYAWIIIRFGAKDANTFRAIGVILKWYLSTNLLFKKFSP